jgi:tocopherol cyclase
MVNTPTERGLELSCRDTLKGLLSIDLHTRQGENIITATSTVAGLEIGGAGWDRIWTN